MQTVTRTNDLLDPFRASFSVIQDEIKDFVRKGATRALPHLQVLGCLPANDGFFYLHLRDPFSQASLLLPVATQWVEDCKPDCDFKNCRLGQAFQQAAKILDFRPLTSQDAN